MELRVKGGGSLSGEVRLQPSKLYTQFLSVLAFLGEGRSVVRRPLAVRDTLPLLRELEKLGATLNRGAREWTIWGTGGRIGPKGSVLEAGNSGTAFGMLLGLASLSSRVLVVTGDAQLRRRSMVPLLRMFRALGGDLSSTGSGGNPPFIVFGRGLRGGRVEGVKPPELFPLLLVSPFTREGVEAEVGWEGERMLEILRRAGARISGKGRKIGISPGVLKPQILTVPPSFYAAAPFVLASLLTDSKLVFRGEGEGEGAPFLRLLQEMGVGLVRGGGGWRVRGGPRGARLDLSGRAEVFPYAAVLASLAEGKTVFRGLSRAREMKSDRLSLTVENLRKMGARVSREGEGVVVEGVRRLKGARVKGGDDYAVVAAFVAAGLAAEGETVVVDGPRALRTSYSGFLSEWRRLGAEVEVGEV
jgi:3-phosphoshikimate 1-carboxyvinyltransferase